MLTGLLHDYGDTILNYTRRDNMFEEAKETLAKIVEHLAQIRGYL